jgi:hypothetical protein
MKTMGPEKYRSEWDRKNVRYSENLRDPFFLQAEKWIRRLMTMGSRHFVMSPLDFLPGRKLTIYPLVN